MLIVERKGYFPVHGGDTAQDVGAGVLVGRQNIAIDQHDQAGQVAPGKCKPEQQPRTQPACVDEALILIKEEIYTRTDTRSGGDPLFVRRRAKPGATVRVYNPEMPGWPEV